MQGTRGVGRDKLHQHALAVAGLKAKTFLGRQHFAHHLLLGGGLEANVDEARAGNLNVLHPLLKGGRGQQGLAQLLPQLAGVEFEWLGQLHGRGDGEVAMGCHFGRFKSGLVAGTGQQTIEGLAQSGQQFLFDEEHAGILRATPFLFLA